MQPIRLISLALFLILGAISMNAQAIPSFARQEGVKCSACHSAWPQLNAKGRQFKENGYRFEEDLNEVRKISEVLDDGAPLAAVVIARPYDKKKSGDIKNRAFHEYELFAAGALNNNWSAYAEIEAEDETGFSPVVAGGALNYRFNSALNVGFTWSPYFSADSYGFLGDGFRMTRGHVGAINSAFGGADGGSGLRGTRQVTSIYGRPVKQLFYTVGYSGIASDAEGEDASNLSARIAYDITPNLMAGGFYVDGQNSTTQQNFSRTGFDFQADILGGRLQGMFVNGDDDNTGGGSQTNQAVSVQGMYFIKQGGVPTWVPVVRYDTFEKNDGKDSTSELTLNLTRYFAQNIKGYIEYWQQLDVPDGKDKDDRITAQISLAF